MNRSRWYRVFPPRSALFPSFLSGVLLLLAFPPYSVPGIAAVALVPLLVALVRRRYTRAESFRAGFFCGATFFILLLWWIKDLLPWANVTIPWLMTPALILLVLYLALYPAFFCLLLRVISGGRRGLALATAPALWTLLEMVRSRGEIGFPWGVVGYSLSDFPRMIQSASIAGVFGLSFIILASNSFFAAAISVRGAARRALLAAAGIVILLANAMVGNALMPRENETPVHETARIAVIQPDIDLQIKWNQAYTDSIFRLYEQLARKLKPLEPELYVFPETAAPVYIRYESRYRRRLIRLALDLGSPVYIGYLDARRDSRTNELNVFNAAGLFAADGTLSQQYEKVHLLPFGEALPLSWRFPILKKINFGQGNFQPGTVLDPITAGTRKFGTLICFESIFPGLSRRYVRQGVDFLVNITNDGWFGDTPGPVQHAQMCIMRTVENRRSLVRSANTGISMVVDPWGRIVSSLGLDRMGTLVEPVIVLRERTIYSRTGDVPVASFSLVIVVLALLRTLIRRRSPSGPTNADATRNRT